MLPQSLANAVLVECASTLLKRSGAPAEGGLVDQFEGVIRTRTSQLSAAAEHGGWAGLTDRRPCLRPGTLLVRDAQYATLLNATVLKCSSVAIVAGWIGPEWDAQRARFRRGAILTDGVRQLHAVIAGTNACSLMNALVLCKTWRFCYEKRRHVVFLEDPAVILSFAEVADLLQRSLTGRAARPLPALSISTPAPVAVHAGAVAALYHLLGSVAGVRLFDLSQDPFLLVDLVLASAACPCKPSGSSSSVVDAPASAVDMLAAHVLFTGPELVAFWSNVLGHELAVRRCSDGDETGGTPLMLFTQLRKMRVRLPGSDIDTLVFQATSSPFQLNWASFQTSTAPAAAATASRPSADSPPALACGPPPAKEAAFGRATMVFPRSQLLGMGGDLRAGLLADTRCGGQSVWREAAAAAVSSVRRFEPLPASVLDCGGLVFCGVATCITDEFIELDGDPRTTVWLNLHGALLPPAAAVSGPSPAQSCATASPSQALALPRGAHVGCSLSFSCLHPALVGGSLLGLVPCLRCSVGMLRLSRSDQLQMLPPAPPPPFSTPRSQLVLQHLPPCSAAAAALLRDAAAPFLDSVQGQLWLRHAMAWSASLPRRVRVAVPESAFAAASPPGMKQVPAAAAAASPPGKAKAAAAAGEREGGPGDPVVGTGGLRPAAAALVCTVLCGAAAAAAAAAAASHAHSSSSVVPSPVPLSPPHLRTPAQLLAIALDALSLALPLIHSTLGGPVLNPWGAAFSEDALASARRQRLAHAALQAALAAELGPGSVSVHPGAEWWSLTLESDSPRLAAPFTSSCVAGALETATAVVGSGAAATHAKRHFLCDGQARLQVAGDLLSGVRCGASTSSSGGGGGGRGDRGGAVVFAAYRLQIDVMRVPHRNGGPTASPTVRFFMRQPRLSSTSRGGAVGASGVRGAAPAATTAADTVLRHTGPHSSRVSAALAPSFAAADGCSSPRLAPAIQEFIQSVQCAPGSDSTPGVRVPPPGGSCDGEAQGRGAAIVPGWNSVSGSALTLRAPPSRFDAESSYRFRVVLLPHRASAAGVTVPSSSAPPPRTPAQGAPLSGLTAAQGSLAPVFECSILASVRGALGPVSSLLSELWQPYVVAPLPPTPAPDAPNGPAAAAPLADAAAGRAHGSSSALPSPPCPLTSYNGVTCTASPAPARTKRIPTFSLLGRVEGLLGMPQDAYCGVNNRSAASAMGTSLEEFQGFVGVGETGLKLRLRLTHVPPAEVPQLMLLLGAQRVPWEGPLVSAAPTVGPGGELPPAGLEDALDVFLNPHQSPGMELPPGFGPGAVVLLTGVSRCMSAQSLKVYGTCGGTHLCRGAIRVLQAAAASSPAPWRGGAAAPARGTAGVIPLSGGSRGAQAVPAPYLLLDKLDEEAGCEGAAPAPSPVAAGPAARSGTASPPAVDSGAGPLKPTTAPAHGHAHAWVSPRGPDASLHSLLRSEVFDRRMLRVRGHVSMVLWSSLQWEDASDNCPLEPVPRGVHANSAAAALLDLLGHSVRRKEGGKGGAPALEAVLKLKAKIAFDDGTAEAHLMLCDVYTASEVEALWRHQATEESEIRVRLRREAVGLRGSAATAAAAAPVQQPPTGDANLQLGECARMLLMPRSRLVHWAAAAAKFGPLVTEAAAWGGGGGGTGAAIPPAPAGSNGTSAAAPAHPDTAAGAAAAPHTSRSIAAAERAAAAALARYRGAVACRRRADGLTNPGAELYEKNVPLLGRPIQPAADPGAESDTDAGVDGAAEARGTACEGGSAADATAAHVGDDLLRPQPQPHPPQPYAVPYAKGVEAFTAYAFELAAAQRATPSTPEDATNSPPASRYTTAPTPPAFHVPTGAHVAPFQWDVWVVRFFRRPFTVRGDPTAEAEADKEALWRRGAVLQSYGGALRAALVATLPLPCIDAAASGANPAAPAPPAAGSTGAAATAALTGWAPQLYLLPPKAAPSAAKLPLRKAVVQLDYGRYDAESTGIKLLLRVVAVRRVELTEATRGNIAALQRLLLPPHGSAGETERAAGAGT